MQLNLCCFAVLLTGVLWVPSGLLAQKSAPAAPARSAPAPAAPRQVYQAPPRQNNQVRQPQQNLPQNRQNYPQQQQQRQNVPNGQQGRQFGNVNQPRQPNTPNGQQYGRTDQGRGFGNVNNNQRGQQSFVSRTPNGGTREVHPNGAIYERNAAGRTTSINMPNRGLSVRMNPTTGRPAQITSMGVGNRTVIHRGPMNERRVERIRSVPGGVERMVHSGNWSSIQRPMMGHPGYVQRTVFTGGVSYNTVYRSYPYHGVVLFSPVPAFVYAPAYYGFLLSPWGTPVVYPPAYWGWVGQPWYTPLGVPVFNPYPVYNSPDQWLTDYVVSQGFQQNYQNQQQLIGGDQAPPPPPMSDEDKAVLNQDIRDEISREQQFAAATPQIDQAAAPPTEDTARTAPPPPPEDAPPPAMPEALKDHLFSVFLTPLEVQQAGGEACSLAAGDLLFRTGDAPNPDNTVDVLVKSSHATATHPEYCAPKTQVRVQLTDLQEMFNHKKELLAEGMKQQATLAGRRLPKAPSPQPTQVARGQVDPNTAADVAELKRMLADADKTESEVSVVAVTPGN